ncbi:hypothetical protein JCM11641_000432 [Rhodosporidiobolus odoratus]
MARRKSQFKDDGDSSGDSAESDYDDHSFDPDEQAANDLLTSPYANRGKKRTREQLQEEATYGIWAHEDDNNQRGRGRGVGASANRSTRKTDYLKGQSFVAAGSKPSSALAKDQPIDNLAPTLAIQAPAEDEQDIAMELGSSSEEEGQDDEEERVEREEDDQPESAEDDDTAGDSVEEAQEDLPPIPGLSVPRPRSPTPPPPPRVEPGASLAFAPRGLGAGRGRERGRGRGGLGMRNGIGGIGSSTAPRAAPVFASSGSTLSTVPPSQASSLPSTAAPLSGAASPFEGAATPRAGLGSARPGIGSGSAGIGAGGRGGIGSGSRPQESVVEALRKEVNGPAEREGGTQTERLKEAEEPASTPGQERRSFLPTPSSSSAKASFLPASAAAVPNSKLSATETRHFASLASSGSIGMKMLEKMGWQSGTGLGRERQGIVTPVGEGQKLRKKGEGIRAGERSKGALEEEKRRTGDKDTSGDTATDAAARAEAKHKKHASAWQSSKPKKGKRNKVEYKSYEELLAEQEGEGGYHQQELLVDLTGQALPSQSLSSLPTSLHGSASADPTRLPELRHNLTLLTSTLSSQLRSLAREGAGVAQRRAYLAKEEERVRVKVEEQGRRVRRLEGVMRHVKRVKEMGDEAAEVLGLLESQGQGEIEPKEVLGRFEETFGELSAVYEREYEEMGLDEVVVAALTPLLRRLWLHWDPLTSPFYTVPTLLRFRKLFLIDAAPPDALLAPSNDPYEEEERLAMLRKRAMERSMTPYESLMWGVWVPKIRSAINNVWHPTNPTPAVNLYTSWSPLLPSFLRDNLLNQLILPKLVISVGEWSVTSYKRGELPPLHQIVFPWLEVAGEGRMEGVVEEARRKVRGWVKTGWKAREGVPKGLEVWKEAFPRSDWDSLLLRHVLPPLGAHLRNSFTVNPRQQDLAPLEAVLVWKPLLRSSMLSQLLEAELFPKWGDALYTWLRAEPNLEQVAEWYSWWKSYFSEDVVALSGVARGFRKGLDLMNQAMSLGEDAKYRLKKPDFSPKHGPSSTSTSAANSPRPTSSRRPAAPPPAAPPTAIDDISFRTVVEDLCSASNLVFLPTGKVTGKGQQLFKVSKGIEGRGGVTVYLEDDVVWLLGKDGEFEPVGVEEMVRRAGGGK